MKNIRATNLMYAVSVVFLGALLPVGTGAAAEDFTTVAERTDYRLTSTYEETVDFMQRLEAASPWVNLTAIGRTPQGRNMHLLIVSKDGAFSPEAARATGKVLLLIQNGIHAGEIDGKDACQALLRDIVVTKEKEHLLDDVILLVIPIFSVDGHENRARFTRPNQVGPENAGFRGTAQRLNLNRDYLKLDTPEMQDWVTNWLTWMPDFFVDDHVTDGQDWQYTVTYTAPWHPNSAPSVREWIKTYFDPQFGPKVEAEGYKVFPYAFPFRGEIAKGLRTFVASPRFSTGYTALWNRPGLLVEMHSLKDYESRVRGNYAALVAVLEILNEHGGALQAAVAAADAATLSGLTEPYPLTFEMDDTDSTMVDVHVYEAPTDSSAATGGTHIRLDRSRPVTIRAPYFATFAPKESVIPPRAYLIPREWQQQIGLLRRHGVRFDTLTQPLTAPVELYHFDDIKWDDKSFEGHVRVSYQTTVHETTLVFPVGTAVIDMHQSAAKVVMQALEPQGPDSFLSWGLWNTILERKEYIGSYIIDPLADSMLAADPELRHVYEERLASDSVFAASTSARRDFFYQRSRFYEAGYNWYPVARLMGDLPPAAPWQER